MKDIFPLFLLDRIYLKFGENKFQFKDLKDYLTKTHRVPKKIAVYIIFNLVESKWVIKDKRKIWINTDIIDKVNEELEVAYLESNKMALRIWDSEI